MGAPNAGSIDSVAAATSPWRLCRSLSSGSIPARNKMKRRLPMA